MATKTLKRNYAGEKGVGCVHYWDIEPPDGPVSEGICRYCGERREFFNEFPDINAMVLQGEGPVNIHNTYW